MALTIAHVDNFSFLPPISLSFHPFCSSSSLSLQGAKPASPLRHRHRCLAAADPGPPPPESNRNLPSAKSISEFQDRAQIFFAVLFWMALFFWASAWDGRGGGPGGRSNKGSRYRR